jgi:ubiquinone/menaquinone biosynthesis C-methylase UbiE
MLRRFIPSFLTRAFRDSVYRLVGRPYYASHPGETSYCIRSSVRVRDQAPRSDLPVPPPELWLGYGSTSTEYIESGARDVSTMLDILKQGEFTIERGQKILEFGCCTGRMIRHLVDTDAGVELWGVDLHSEYVQWSRQNLSPEIHFVLSTALPHLPFQDEMFDLIFCGSVFTHIEEFDGSWLMELARIIRPGGCLYFTIHDDHSAALLATKLKDTPFAQRMHSDPVYVEHSEDFSLIAVGRKDLTQVFHHPDYLKALLPPMLKWVSLTHEAYGLQSAVVLQKVPH